MGRAYVSKGEIKQGLTLYDKILTEYPNFVYMPAVLFEMHIAHLKARDSEKALAKLQQLIDTYPDTYMAAQARFIRGKHYYDQGVYQSAIDAYKQVLTDIEDPFKNVLWRGIALRMIGESHQKLEQYNQAIEALQQSLDATQALQESYEQRGISTAHFGAGKAKSLRLLGDTYRDAGRYDEAIASYNQVVNTYPNDYNMPLALYAMAQIFSEQGKTEQAIETYQQLIARDANYREQAEKEIALLNQATDPNKVEKKEGLTR
jgi:tetratricopeptide (TPR) repeat protein